MAENLPPDDQHTPLEIVLTDDPATIIRPGDGSQIVVKPAAGQDETIPPHKLN
jgi:hypothetical protein